MKTTKGNVVIIIVIIVALVLGGYFFFARGDSGSKDYKKATYSIDGEQISFKNGGSAKYLGEELIEDLDGNGEKDAAFLFSRDTATTTLFYLAAALKTEEGYRSTKARLIGEKIIPVNIEWKNENIVVNYIDRMPGDPITAAPTTWYSKTFGVRDGELLRAISVQ